MFCVGWLSGKSKSCENELCTVTFLDLKCGRRKRKFRHLAGNKLQTLMSAEFEMQVGPVTPTGQTLRLNAVFLMLRKMQVVSRPND